jgi:hypothetical protein
LTIKRALMLSRQDSITGVRELSLRDQPYL